MEGIRCTFYEVYPQLVAAYNPAAQTVVPLTLAEEPKLPPAWAIGGGLYINKGHIARRASSLGNAGRGLAELAAALRRARAL